jgi:hypothetical protein
MSLVPQPFESNYHNNHGDLLAAPSGPVVNTQLVHQCPLRGTDKCTALKNRRIRRLHQLVRHPATPIHFVTFAEDDMG